MKHRSTQNPEKNPAVTRKAGVLAAAVFCALASFNAVATETKPVVITTKTTYTDPVQITNTIAGTYNGTESYLTGIMVTGTAGKLQSHHQPNEPQLRRCGFLRFDFARRR